MTQPAAVQKKQRLKVLDFSKPLTPQEIEEFGQAYVTKHFSLHGPNSTNPAFFCKTTDGILVFFRSTYLKLLGRENDGIRSPEACRIRRLHWIIPIIEEAADELILRGDFDGALLGGSGSPGTIYRLYWLPARMYVVFLRENVGRRKKKSYNLISAYTVTEKLTREMLERLFPRQIKNPLKRT